MGMLYKYGSPKNRASNFKVCIAVCCFDSVTAAYSHSIMATCLELQKRNIEFMTLLFSGNCHVDDARNLLVRDFLDSDCTDLVFIDADLHFEPEDFIQLISHDEDVIGGVYPYKEDILHFVVNELDTVEIKDQVAEVKGIGTGFMKIKRHVIESLDSIAQHHFDQRESGGQVHDIPVIFERIIADNTRLGGDLAFCWKWRNAGGKIFCDPFIKIGHIGPKEFTGLYSADIKRRSIGMKLEIEAIRNCKETPRDIIELTEIWGNSQYSATAEFLMAAILIARETEGKVLELGTGLTTLAIAAAINGARNYHAFEQSQEWAKYVNGELKKYGIDNVLVNVCSVVNGWYNTKIDQDYGLIICDGPQSANLRMNMFNHFTPKRGTKIIIDDYKDIDNEALETHCCNIIVLGEIRKFVIATCKGGAA